MTRFLTTTESSPATLATTDGNQYPVAPAPGGSGPVVVPPLYSVVVRPGDTSGADNVFPSWAAMYAACSGIPGGVRVLVDDRIVTPVQVPAGTYNLDGWEIYGCNDNATSEAANLNFENGAHITYEILYLWNLFISNTSTSAVVSQANNGVLYAEGVLLFGSATAPFMEGNVVGMDIFMVSGELGDGTHNALSIAAGSGTESITILATDQATIATSAVGGAGAGVGFTCFVSADVTCDYTNPGTFNNVPPPNTAVSAANFAAAAASITTANVSVTRARSGLVLVLAQMSVTCSATTNVTMNLNMDGVAIAGGPVSIGTSFAPGGQAVLTLAWLATLPDAAAHTFSATATAAAGTITATSGGATKATQITAIEQG